MHGSTPCKNCSTEKMRAFAYALYEKYGRGVLWTPGKCNRMTAVMHQIATEIEEGKEVSKSNALQVFSFEQQQVRVVKRNGQPWWVVKDVCDVLGLSNPTEAIKSLDDDEKNSLRISEGIRGNPNMAVISESGLYTLILRSNKPEARRFRKWITGEVLPALRRTGEYATPEAQKKKADNRDELAMKRLEIQEKNANWRKAKLLFDMMNKYDGIMTPESKIVFLTECAQLASGHDMSHALPAATEKWYSAAELGDLYGVSANKIGRIANEQNLKAQEGQSNEYGTWIRSKSPNSPKEIPTWVYYEKAAEWFGEYFKEAKSA